MKTVKEWYETLPEEVKLRAVELTSKDELQKEEESLKNALGGSFVFRNTPEGYDYWLNIIEQYESKH